MEEIDELIDYLNNKIIEEQRWAHLGSSGSTYSVKEFTHIIERLENIKKIIVNSLKVPHLLLLTEFYL